MSRKVIFPGSFDPLTLGHYNVLFRLKDLFDEVYIAVAVNLEKKPMFSLDERKYMIENIVSNSKFDNIYVVAFEGLVTDFMKKHDIKILARGLRDSEDLSHESRISRMNKILYPEMETVFLHTAEEFAYISSSLIKEILRFDGPINGLVPDVLVDYIENKKC